jgi:hypothetical protein
VIRAHLLFLSNSEAIRAEAACISRSFVDLDLGSNAVTRVQHQNVFILLPRTGCSLSMSWGLDVRSACFRAVIIGKSAGCVPRVPTCSCLYVSAIVGTRSQTIFDAGLRRARTAQAVAVYDASVASKERVCC